MRTIPELEFGFRDAENYRSKDYKDLFNQVFIRTDELDKLANSNTYFLMGEKGTGKTAFAMYYTNNDYKETLSRLHYIRETEYEKFITLKKEKHLTLSDYSSIWKVILYLLMSEKLYEEEKNILTNAFSNKFKNLKKAIDEYYAHAFSPEIIYALNFIEKSGLAANIVSKYVEIAGSNNSEVSFSEDRFQINLLYLKKQFENSLSSIKLNKNHLIFIDGIDIRPRHVPYEDYLECIKGLANAVWEINNDYFSTIKDSSGRMKVVLLMRPDIYASLGLQNMNNKFRDNSVLLDWRTTYPQFRNSAIFQMIDKLLSSQQQESLRPGAAWDYYFPYRIHYENKSKWNDHSFIGFLRNSFYRPRDIISMLELLQQEFIKKQKNPADVFSFDDFEDSTFQKNYADFLLGEIKDHLSFYYSEKDYDIFLKFFTFLNGQFEFSYDKFIAAFKRFTDFINRNDYEKPAFCDTADTFLQFLYETNVICYIEFTDDEPFFRWCYRERDFSNISPKVKTEETYRIHYGLSKALNVGKAFKPKRTKKVADVYIENIDYHTKPHELKKLFSQFGDVVKVTIPKDHNNERGRGFAFVQMNNKKNAQKAIDSLHGKTFKGREIRLNW